MATARAAFSGATTAGKSISGRWMAWGSKRKGVWRTLQFPLNVPVSGNWSVRHTPFRFDPQAIHLPEIDLPAVVAPENAALAVAIEVVRDVARTPDRGQHVDVAD